MQSPTVAAVHDLSCVGRCALTVVIPVLAAMGIQPCPLPTAVLSTHTGGYRDIAMRDLTGFMEECVGHWRSLGLRFDAVYSGYLATVTQAETVLRLIEWQEESDDPLIVVDPVMGDDGKLYSSMPSDMPAEMCRLCAKADLITPNMTEVALLTGTPYDLTPRTPAQIEAMFSALDAKCAVVTSVPLPNGRWANVLKRRGERGYWQAAFEPVPVHYPGTGDLFTSVMTGALVLGASPQSAMARATRFVRSVVARSEQVGGEVRSGVQLESGLAELMRGEEAPVELIDHP